jgi:hypothetical protein
VSARSFDCGRRAGDKNLTGNALFAVSTTFNRNCAQMRRT